MPPNGNSAQGHPREGDRPDDARAHDDPNLADGVRFGRSGLDDAPVPLPKRWLLVSVGLAAAVVAAVVIVGTGTFSIDADVDPDVAEPTESLAVPETVGISPLTRATGVCLGTIRDERNADSTGVLGIPPASADLSVVYQHQSTERAAVAVTDGTLTALCVSSPEGFFGTSYTEGQTPAPLHQYLRAPAPSGESVVRLLAGEVAGDVQQVEILIDGAPVGRADVADGYFSAFLDAPAGEDLAYVVTSSNGRTDTVSADEFATSQTATDNNDAARACLNYLNITVAEPEPHGNRGPQDFDSAYDLIAAHTQRDYVLAAATDGATVTACVEAPSITWVATQAHEMPAGQLIAPAQPTVRPAGTKPHPVVGRVADSVTMVQVITSDGQRIEAHTEDGFYAALVPGDRAEVRYVVHTDNGQSTTIVAD